MEFTGELYGFYSDKPIEYVCKNFLDKLIGINYLYEKSEYCDEQILFCYKNKEMYEYHLEHGYNSDLKGEGCFCLESKVTSLNGVASLFEFEGEKNFAPQNISLFINEIYYYRLILPDLIEDLAFSKIIFELFSDILK